MGDRIIVINGERGWLNLGTLLAFIAVALVFAAYAMIPVVVTTVLMTLLFWLVLPRLPGVPAIHPVRALLMSLLVIVAYVIPTVILRFFVQPLGLGLMLYNPDSFGLNPLTQRLLWMNGQLMLTWPQEILFHVRNIGHPGAFVVLLSEIPGILVAGLALKLGIEGGFKGAAGYAIACGAAAGALLLVAWIGMTLEVMIVPKMVGESFHMITDWM